MSEENVSPRFRPLPVQLVRADDGVILCRGAMEFKVMGDVAAETVQILLQLAAGEGSTREEMLDFFPEPDRAAIDELLQRLILRRILVPVGGPDEVPATEETPLDVFYWNLQLKAGDVTRKLAERRFAVIGVNGITRQLVAALTATGVSGVTVVDDPLLRNLSMFEGARVRERDWCPAPAPHPVEASEWRRAAGPSDLDCVIAASDFGCLEPIKQWNELCVQNGIHFFPVVLNRLVGHVGPLVIPGDTACHACLRLRENSHMESGLERRTSEAAAFYRQQVSGYHPSMASILGDLAAMELTKFYGELFLRQAGTLLEMNLLAPGLKVRRVLKVPRCPVCSPMRGRATTAVEKHNYVLPGRSWEELTSVVPKSS